MPNKAALREVLGSETNNKSVHAQALLKVIQSAQSADERVELLGIALAERDTVPKNPRNLPNKGIDLGLWGQLNKTHLEMVNGYLKMAFFRTPKLADFAREVLRFIDFFSEENEKIYVLSTALYSPYVPYQQLPGTPVHMSDHEYSHKLKSDPNRVNLIEYITGLPFGERTEWASMILQVVDDTTDRNLRVALLAYARSQQEKRIIQNVLNAVAVKSQ